MPAPVLFSERGISKVVLLAQLVGNRRRRRIQVPRIANDFGVPSAVVGHLAERACIHAVVAAPAGPAALSAAASNQLRPAAAWKAAAPADGRRERKRNRWPGR